MPDEPPDLRQALREADWDKLLPGLLVYAANRLRRVGWASGRDVEPSKMSVEELVHTAVEHCLDGTRTWDPAAVDLGGFLRGVIRSLTSSERKKYVRAKTLTNSEVADRNLPSVESAEDDATNEEDRVELLEILEACTADDPDLGLLYLAILDGHTKREDLADVLGWTVDRVTAARIKLQRRLVRREPSRFAVAREKRRRIS